MAQKKVHILTLLVDNEFGVLTRITALIRREGWNIKSLAVSETKKREISRLTISLECLDSALEQVLYRLGRLDCVKSVSAFSPQTHICRELLVLHVKTNDALDALVREAGARLLLRQSECSTIELTDTPEALDAFLALAEPLGILGLTRTGATTLENINTNDCCRE